MGNKEETMKPNRIAQSNLFEDLEAIPPTSGVAILNKERCLEILKSEAFNG